MVFHGAGQDYSKSGFTENTITLGVNTCTQNIKITYENGIPWGQTKIIQKLGSQKIRIHWVSIFVPRTCGLHMKMIFHVDRSRLRKIWSCRKYVYTGPQYLYQNIKVTHGNGVPWGGPRLFKVWIHGKYDYAGRQHLHTTHKNYI